MVGQRSARRTWPPAGLADDRRLERQEGRRESTPGAPGQSARRIARLVPALLPDGCHPDDRADDVVVRRESQGIDARLDEGLLECLSASGRCFLEASPEPL